ncbi:super-infection exclusion protein B [Halomonas sp. 11-S5]|uniref:super-infection exclusion protein B n=1 Tax=Halomonas sp. 11-S5 TaxID=2994064 RepID=UPI002468CD43|nr:super-infection exclusion protein B [Halomonas sp. 11-S5]
MEFIAKFLDAAKLPTKFIVAIFFASTIPLLLPSELVAALRLSGILDSYGSYMGVTSVLSGSVMVIEFTIWVSKKIKKAHLRRRLSRLSKSRLRSLDHAEKAVLREFYIQGQNTIKLPMDQPVVAGLLSSGILSIVSQHGKCSLAGMLVSMKIPDRLSEEITLEMLDLPTGEPSEEDIEFLKENRPPFTRSIQREEAHLQW